MQIGPRSSELYNFQKIHLIFKHPVLYARLLCVFLLFPVLLLFFDGGILGWRGRRVAYVVWWQMATHPAIRVKKSFLYICLPFGRRAAVARGKLHQACVKAIETEK